MRISDILFWHNQATARYRDGPQLDLRQARFSDAMTKAAGDYEKDRLLKRFWELKRLENQPSGPAPSDAETELIPSGTPTAAATQAVPIETEPLVGRHRLVPFQQSRGVLGD